MKHAKREGRGGGERRFPSFPPLPLLSYFGSRPIFARAKCRSLVFLCSPTPRKRLLFRLTEDRTPPRKRRQTFKNKTKMEGWPSFLLAFIIFVHFAFYFISKYPFSSYVTKSKTHEKMSCFDSNLRNLWYLKITPKHSLVRCLYHLSASCSARSKKKSEQEYDEG